MYEGQELLQLVSVDLTILQGDECEILIFLPFWPLRSFADKEVQATAFRAQIQLALRFNLPLVLHVRDDGRSWDGGQAEEDCYQILAECDVPRTTTNVIIKWGRSREIQISGW